MHFHLCFQGLWRTQRHIGWCMPLGTMCSTGCCCQGAWDRAGSLPFSKLVPGGKGGRLQIRFGVFLTLVSELEVYSMLSPLKEPIRFPEWGEGIALGGADLGKLDEQSWLVRQRGYRDSLNANSSWEEGLSDLMHSRLSTLRSSGLTICSCVF